MRIKSHGYGIKGWYGVKRYALRMQSVSDTAQKRLKILDFWKRHGLAAAKDAFGVSRRTLYHWQRAYRAAEGQAHALNEKSRAPLRRRGKRPWDAGVLERLLQLRAQMPGIGLEKLHVFLLDWCEPRGLHCPSVSTLRRRARQDVRLAAVHKRPPASTRAKGQGQRRPKGYIPKAPGECVGVDTIEIHGSGPWRGMRRYVMTFKDMYSRFALAAAVPSKHAKNATRLWHLARACYPFKPQRVLSDNGSEFKADFTKTVLNDGAARWLTYPNCPKMNAHAERFNRSIQEEFIEFHKDLLFDDIDAFNDKLLEYLIWFNEERPHYALNLLSPIQFLEKHQCNMYWRNTRPLRDIKSWFTLGQTSTDGWVFNSLPFTGVRLGSDRRMRPEWEQQFAPVVHGTARTNARVRVEQLGSIIYETTVPPGPFALDDLPATGARGELLVTVTEADGAEQRFTVYQTGMQEMLRPGQTDYALSLGRFDGQGRLARNPWLIQGNMRYGFSNSMTAYAGFLGAEGYSALALGSAFNLPIGSLATDVTLAQAGALMGYSARATYTRNMAEMGTYLNLSAYRHSSTYFDATQGFNIRNGMAWDALLQRRNQLILGVNQRLPYNWGTISSSVGYSDYWNLSMREVEYQMDYSVVLQKKFTMGLSVSRNLNTLANRWSTQAMLTFSMPLGGDNPTYLQTRHTRTDAGQSLMAGMSSAFGKNNQVSYQIFATADKPRIGSMQSTGLANLSWRAPRATVNASAYVGRGNRQLGLGLSGSLVAFNGGLVLGSETVGETTAIVRAPGAAGARIENRIGATLDGSGKGMVYAHPYRLNRIRLGAEGLSSDVQLKSTEQQVAPTAGAVVVLDYETDVGYSILIHGRQANGAPLPFTATVLDARNMTVGYVGQGGQALVRVAQLQGELTVQWGMRADQRCTLTYSVDKAINTGEPFRRLDDLVCQAANGVGLADPVSDEASSVEVFPLEGAAVQNN